LLVNLSKIIEDCIDKGLSDDLAQFFNYFFPFLLSVTENHQTLESCNAEKLKRKSVLKRIFEKESENTSSTVDFIIYDSVHFALSECKNKGSEKLADDFFKKLKF
jgi:hypothetical protein